MKKWRNNFGGVSALQIGISTVLISISGILLAYSFRVTNDDAASSSGAPSAAFVYTMIHVPGTTNTGLGGINNLGHLVGGYILPDQSRHGFSYIGGMFATVDHPYAKSGTQASDINGSDQIVGSYNFTDPDHPFEGAHGFLLIGGTATAIDFPAGGVTSTTPEGINDLGDLVGLYRMNGPGIGFLFSGGVYTRITYPGGCCTHANGINNAGQIVGQYKTPDDSAPHQGFLKTGNTYTTINYPKATDTVLQDINSSGDIIGNAVAGGFTFGFLYTGGNFFTVAFPGAAATVVTHNNDNGEILGYYQDNGRLLHGFKAVPATPTPAPPPRPSPTPTSISPIR